MKRFEAAKLFDAAAAVFFVAIGLVSLCFVSVSWHLGTAASGALALLLGQLGLLYAATSLIFYARLTDQVPDGCRKLTSGDNGALLLGVVMFTTIIPLGIIFAIPPLIAGPLAFALGFTPIAVQVLLIAPAPKES